MHLRISCDVLRNSERDKGFDYSAAHGKGQSGDFSKYITMPLYRSSFHRLALHFLCLLLDTLRYFGIFKVLFYMK
ncbi:hypothetical protein P73_4000 [Celeribacter indicus]|uniref:Uncharacterized protein n=1 Tax=Celeribacter indicus TaxID=1208324 RepID=A0A0B5E5Q6_9RHOB|nr:hypothetical protein P73_4000 [Celeribacter indicus]